MKTKIALNLVKGDVIKDGKTKATVLLVILTDEMRAVTASCKMQDGETKLLRYHWKDEVELWSPSTKRRRKAFITRLAKYLRVPIKVM